MTDNAIRLKDEILRLSEDDREELARILWDSIHDSQEEMDDEVAWVAELERRAADLKAGRAIAEPADQVMAELREEALREKRA